MGNPGRGGAQPGAGRPKRADEEKTYKACMKAIVNKYGSLEEGIEAVLSGEDEKIKLLIWQHILGVPETKSKVKLTDSAGQNLQPGVVGGLVVEVVRTIHNKDVPMNDTKDSNDNSTRLPDVQP